MINTMNFESFTDFIHTYQNISNDDEASEQFINSHLSAMMSIQDHQLVLDILHFLSEISGDCEGFERLISLLNHFQVKGLISEHQAEEFIHNSPCNRWL